MYVCKFVLNEQLVSLQAVQIYKIKFLLQPYFLDGMLLCCKKKYLPYIFLWFILDFQSIFHCIVTFSPLPYFLIL